MVAMTPLALADPAVRPGRRQGVIVVDAVSTSGETPCFTLRHANRTRFYGLLDGDARPASRDGDYLAVLYNFRKVSIPAPAASSGR